MDLASMLRAFQFNFMVYKWTMVMEFSFKYCIDTKAHKSKEEIKVIVSESAIGLTHLPEAMQDGGVPTEH